MFQMVAKWRSVKEPWMGVPVLGLFGFFGGGGCQYGRSPCCCFLLLLSFFLRESNLLGWVATQLLSFSWVQIPKNTHPFNVVLIKHLGFAIFSFSQKHINPFQNLTPTSGFPISPDGRKEQIRPSGPIRAESRRRCFFFSVFGIKLSL